MDIFYDSGLLKQEIDNAIRNSSRNGYEDRCIKKVIWDKSANKNKMVEVKGNIIIPYKPYHFRKISLQN